MVTKVYKISLFMLCVILISSLLITGCEPPVATEKIVGEPESLPPADVVIVYLLIPDLPSATKELVSSQISEFNRNNPDINVKLEFAPSTSFIGILKEVQQVNVAAVNYNDVIQLQMEGLIIALDEIFPDKSRFWEDALASNTLGKELYGMPWLRYECAPNYLNLVLTKSTPEAVIPAASKLMDFLTVSPQQEDFIKTDWFPTLKEFYDSGTVQCDPIEAIRLAPRNIELTIRKVANDIKPLVESYKVIFNPEASTGHYDGDRSLMRISPAIDSNQVYEGFKVLGALMIDDQEWADKLKVSRGNYMVACKPEIEKSECFLFNPLSDTLQISPYILDTSYSGNLPTVSVVRGSVGGCFWIFGLRMCVGIGSTEQPQE